MSYERGPFVLAIVPASAVDVVWDDVADAIGRAVSVAGGTHALEDVREELIQGKSQLWVMRFHGTFMAAAVTRVIVYPRMRVLSIDWIGGSEMDQWLDWGYSRLKEFAVLNQCKCIDGYGRPGWIRAAKKFGLRPVSVTYRAEV